MTKGVLEKDGQLVGPEYQMAVPSGERILMEQAFLAKQNGLMDSKLPAYVDINGHLQNLNIFDQFGQDHLWPVQAEYLNDGKRTHLTRSADGEQNEYGEPTKKLFPKYAAAGHIGTFLGKDLGGKGMPKAFVGGIAQLGFTYNPDFYLKEMVTQGVLNLLEESYKTEKDATKKEYLANVIEQLRSGEATGAMVLTEPETGANIGKMTATTRYLDDGTVRLNGSKKYITGHSLAGVPGVKNSFAVVVTATQEKDGSYHKGASVSIVPLYKTDEKGNLLLEDGKPVKNPGLTTSEPIYKRGMSEQLLQAHDFDNLAGIALSEPKKGWPVMFKTMDPARLEVGAQTVGHVHDLITLAIEHTSKKHQNTVEGKALAEREPVAMTINRLRAFAQTASAVIMNAGMNLDLAKTPEEVLTPEQQKERATAINLAKLESSFIKGYVTEIGTMEIESGMKILGSDGYTTLRPQKIRDNNHPSMIYEGPNEMMAKQVIVQQLEHVPEFIEQTRKQLNALLESERSDQVVDRITDVKKSLRELEKSTDWALDLHAQAAAAKDAGDTKAAERATAQIASASMDFMKQFGAVYMGREAAKTLVYTEEKIKDKATNIPERAALKDRAMWADMAIQKFTVEATPKLANMKKNVEYARVTDDVKALVDAFPTSLENVTGVKHQPEHYATAVRGV